MLKRTLPSLLLSASLLVFAFASGYAEETLGENQPQSQIQKVEKGEKHVCAMSGHDCTNPHGSSPSGMAEEITKVVDPICGMTSEPKQVKHFAVYDGHLYPFCSKECLQTFKENPEKHAGRLVKDPVCGKIFFDNQTDIVLEHEGRDFYFSSPECAEKFKADPAKYTKAQK
jgi:YHS domain-containing protein